jgi:hypothetical protein
MVFSGTLSQKDAYGGTSRPQVGPVAIAANLIEVGLLDALHNLRSPHIGESNYLKPSMYTDVTNNPCDIITLKS